MKRFGFWSALVLAACLAGVALGYKPWKAYLEQRRVANDQQLEMNRAEASRAALAAEKAKLESRSGREALVREHNYVKPGEKGPQ